VPTYCKYCFKGKEKTAARTDLAIFSSLENGMDNKPLINIEFKEGQPTDSQIEKDWQKLISEPVKGVCFFHILQNRNSRTILRLLDKYENSYNEAIFHHQNPIHDKWIVFFLLILFKQEYLTMTFDTINGINFDNLRKVSPIEI